ncbi:MAG TPA: hypothetical protein VGL73_04830, partial [Caulobacteraceae bacterium]
MVEDNTWKIVERTCIVIGALGGLGGLAFEALSYFKAPAADNKAAAVTHAAAGTPAWVVIVLVLFAILLLGTGWAMMIERRRHEAITAAQAAPGLRLKALSEKGNLGFGPDYKLWDSFKTYRLSQAAQLWADQIPSQKFAVPTEIRAAEAYAMLENAAMSGDLDAGNLDAMEFHFMPGGGEGIAPGVQ